MRVSFSSCVQIVEVVVLAHLKPVYDPRWNLESTQHYCHRCRKVLAVTLARSEQKLRERISLDLLQLERVLELSLEIILQRPGFLVRGRGGAGDFMGELADPG